MTTLKGNLVKLALEGYFDAIGHGTNCFCAQKSGIASTLNNVFNTGDSKLYSLESLPVRGDKSKLGKIQGNDFPLPHIIEGVDTIIPVTDKKIITVYNCYTQYSCGTNRVHLDYDALGKCLESLNVRCKGMELGLPRIGCGLGGGYWNIVKQMIENIIKDVDVTIVEL